MNPFFNLSPAEVESELDEISQTDLLLGTGQAHPTPAQIALHCAHDPAAVEDRNLYSLEGFRIL